MGAITRNTFKRVGAKPITRKTFRDTLPKKRRAKKRCKK